MQPINSEVRAAIVAELRSWQADGRRNAADSLVRIAELLQDTGAAIDLPTFYARRDGRVLDR
jgi:hypothetical protein